MDVGLPSPPNSIQVRKKERKEREKREIYIDYLFFRCLHMKKGKE